MKRVVLFLSLLLSLSVASTIHAQPRILVNGYAQQTIDPNAQAYLTAAGITDPTLVTAANHLVINLKDSSLWDATWALWPIMGGSSSSCSINLFDPSTYILSYTGGITYSSTGMVGNGSTGVANTGILANSSFISSTAGAMGFYSRTDNATSAYDMGSGMDAGTNRILTTIARFTGDKSYGVWGNGGYACNATNTNGTGLYYINYTLTNHEELVKNGSVIATANEAVILPAYNIYLMAFNGGSGGTVFYSNKEFALAFVFGRGLTASEIPKFNSIISQFITEAGK